MKLHEWQAMMRRRAWVQAEANAMAEFSAVRICNEALRVLFEASDDPMGWRKAVEQTIDGSLRPENRTE